jgi:transcriptional regulator with XRE-family HTH domain
MNEGSRIKDVRKTVGLTLDAFGNRLGVSKAAISRLENGFNALTDQMCIAICREFSVNEQWLRTGEGEMFSSSLYDELDKVVEKYHLNDKAGEMLRKFVELPQEDMEVIYNYMEKVVNAILEKQAKEEKAAPAAFGMTEDEIRKAGEVYMDQLRLERKQAEGSHPYENTGSDAS